MELSGVCVDMEGIWLSRGVFHVISGRGRWDTLLEEDKSTPCIGDKGVIEDKEYEGN